MVKDPLNTLDKGGNIEVCFLTDKVHLLYEMGSTSYTGRVLDKDNEDIGLKLTLPFSFWQKPHHVNQVKKQIKTAVKKAGIEVDDFDEAFESAMMIVQENYDYAENLRNEDKQEKREMGDGPETMHINGAANEWLTRSDLLTLVDHVIHYYMVGETKNALTVLLVLLSAKTEEPANLRPTGESSIGKSFLVTRVAQLFPEEDVIVRKGFSNMAVWNKGTPVDGEEDRRVWDLRGKSIIVLEEASCLDFLEQFRPVLSHDKEVITYEVTNTESKERSTLKIDIVGWPAYIGLQIGTQLDEQEQTRTMTLTPDSGKEKYEKAILFDAIKSESPWRQRKIKTETEILRRALGKLKSYPVLIPHRVNVQKYFPHSRKRHMRDWKNFKALCEAVTILYQQQRPILQIDGVEYLVAAPGDMEAALLIMEAALSETLAGLGSSEQKFWKHIRPLAVEGYQGLMKQYEVLFGESITESTLRRKYIYPLKDKGLIEIEEGKGRQPSIFRACGNLSTISANYDNLVSAASNRDLDGSTFDFLLRTTESVQTHLRGTTDNKETEAVDGPTMENFVKLWEYLCMADVVRYNQEVLRRDYDQDYGVIKSKSPLVDKVGIKAPKKVSAQAQLPADKDAVVDRGRDPHLIGSQAATEPPDNGSEVVEDPALHVQDPLDKTRDITEELAPVSKMKVNILNTLTIPLDLGDLQYAMGIGDPDLPVFNAAFEDLRQSGAVMMNDKDQWEATK